MSVRASSSFSLGISTFVSPPTRSLIRAKAKQGLADHKDSLGAPLCPCRHYDDKPAEAGQGFWNCPCVRMRERKKCHCMLFLTPDNDFAGQEQYLMRISNNLIILLVEKINKSSISNLHWV
ncbi:hypothetical protein UlMin_001590 [Ulmus minor]